MRKTLLYTLHNFIENIFAKKVFYFHESYVWNIQEPKFYKSAANICVQQNNAKCCLIFDNTEGLKE